MDLTYVLIAVGLLVIIAVIANIARNTGGSLFSPYTKKRLITKHEMIFYKKLVQAISGTNYIILSQVSMGAIIQTKRGLDQSGRMKARNKFSQKIVDFIITDERGYALLLIELDDSSHNLSKDRDRDRMTSQAGYPTARFRNAGRLAVQEIRTELQRHLS